MEVRCHPFVKSGKLRNPETTFNKDLRLRATQNPGVSNNFEVNEKNRAKFLL
jgi:hypothetical protein